MRNPRRRPALRLMNVLLTALFIIFFFISSITGTAQAAPGGNPRATTREPQSFTHIAAPAAQFDFPADLNKSFSPITINSGGVSTLSVSIFNSNSFALTLSSDPPAWSDTLPTGVFFADPPNINTTCGGTVTTIGTTLALIGGTVPEKVESTPGSCTVSVDVTSIVPGNHINAIPAESLNATDPGGTLLISNPTSAEATLGVSSVQPPSLSKSFAPNTIWVAQNSTMSITLRNTDTATPLTEVSITDTLPANITIASPPAASQCGGTVTYTSDSITLTGGTVPRQISGAPGQCIITASVSSVTPGMYTNIIPAGAIQSRQGVTNASAASAPLNVQAIGIAKSFSPGNFQVGSSATLTITLRNPTGTPYTGAAFTDTLPAGLTLASAPASPQCGGTVTSTASSVTLSGGIIPAGTTGSPGVCTVTAVVTSATSASYTNTIPAGGLTTDQGASNVLPASANITVYASGLGLTGSKSFELNSIAVGGTSQLRIYITAPADTSLSDFSISDALPAGVRVANPPSPSKNTNCPGGVWSPAAGSTLLTYTGGAIPAGTQCRLFVNVTSDTPGVHTNTISPANISNFEDRNVGGNFSGNLTVSGISVAKDFAPDTVNVNGISTLTITLTNTNTTQIVNAGLTDVLPAQMVIATTPNASTTCPNGSVTAAEGSDRVALSGATIPAQVLGVPGICTIVVDVQGVGAAGTYTNTIPIGDLSGTIDGPGTLVSNRVAASAPLTIQNLTIGVVKGFSPVSVFGGSASTLSITLSNPNNRELSGITFTDELPQEGPGKGMTIANPPGLDVGTCGGAITASPGDTSFTFSGGYLPASGTCTLSLSVTMNVNSNLTNTIGVGDVTSTSGAANTQGTNATLTNQPGASVSKAFLTNPIQVGGTSVLRITIANSGNIDLTGMGLTDDLPDGLLITDSPAPANTCGGTLTANPGETQIQLTGGALAGILLEDDPAVTCTLEVGVTAAAPGDYENCIPPNSLTNDQNASNQSQTCDTLTSISPPAISKTFSPDTIAAGGSSQLTFTLTNPAANTVALTGVAFSDTFPAGMTVVGAPNPAQCGGIVSSTAGSVNLSGGSLGVNGSCTVTVQVTAADGGTYNNTSANVTSTNGGEGNSASDTLEVVDPPAIGKAFAPNPIASGGVSTLTFTLTNPNASTALTGVAFTDDLPTGMQVADTPNASTTGCDASSTPVFSPQADDTALAFSSGSIAGGGTCTIAVDVTAPGGSYPNTSSTVVSTNGGEGNTASDTLTVTGVGLALEKTTSNAAFQGGGSIEYTYTLTNTGDGMLWAPFEVSDDHINGNTPFICGAEASMEPAATLQCTNTYSVQPADVTARSVTNTAAATAMDAETDGSPVPSNEDSVTVRLAHLTLTKSTTTTGYRNAGNTITYNYTITNTGDVTLYGTNTDNTFLITDDRIDSGTPFACGSATSLAPGANLSCTRTYTVTAGDVTIESVTNIATAEAEDSAGDTVTSDPKSVTVYLVRPPSISKNFSPDPIPAGTTSTLTFTITNPSGNVIPLTGVGFSDTFPAGMTVAIAPLAAQCGGTVSAPATNRVTLSGGTVLPDSTCTVSVEVTAAVSGSYTNTSGAVTSTNGGNGNTASDTLQVVSPPVISKAFSPTMISIGETSTITFTISNPNTGAALTGVAFSDPLPAGLQVAGTPNASTSGCSATSTPVFNPGNGDTTLTFSAGSIAASGVCTVSVDVVGMTQGIKNNTTSIVTSSEGGSGSTSNTAQLNVDAPALALTKSITAGDPYSAVGSTISYSYELENTGNVTLIGPGVGGLFTVTDDKVTVTCTPTPTGLAPGASLTCSASYSVTQADLDSGSVTNLAQAHGRYGSTPVNSNNDTETAAATQNPALTLVKSIQFGSTYAVPGDVITYRYLLTNIGNVTLTGGGPGGVFTVTDDQVTVTCPSTPVSLAPTGTVTCTAEYTISQADIDAGSVTNIATAHALFGSTPVDSNSDTQTADANQQSGLVLEKTILSGDPYIRPGDQVTYQYALTNSENVTLTGDGPGGVFTITDDHIGSPPGTAFGCGTETSLAPDESLTCSAVYTITQADIDSETVTNTASGHGLFGTEPVTSNQDSITAYVKNGSIVGLVYNDRDLDGLPDAGEQGLTGVTVRIYDSTGVTLVATTTTGADGRYAVQDLLPRTYIVVEEDPNGYVSSTANRVTVTVPPDGTETVDFGDYQLEGASTNHLSGVVYEDANENGVQDEGETPLEGITITLYDNGGNVVDSTITGPGGAFSFGSLPPGVYTLVETDGSGYSSTTLNSVSVVMGSRTRAEVDFGDRLGEAVNVDPAVTKQGDPASARIGDTVVFTITVGNNGTADALDVTLTDTKPDFLDIISVTVSPDEGFPVTIQENGFSVQFGTIEPADVFTVTVVTVVNEYGRPPGGENLAAVVSSSLGDPVFNNNAARPLQIYQETLPETGFAPGAVTLLREQPDTVIYAGTGLQVEIPALGLHTTIVGIPVSGDSWDVTWLGDRLGYLEGTAFPTWAGNSVITGHVYGADGRPGPFANLAALRWGDEIIVHGFGQRSVYAVRGLYYALPDDNSVFRHEELPWLTLVTCRGYDEKSNSYAMRTVVRAVLVSVESE